ncbi:hypothetical protein DRN67_01180, partial [Candidatus Micrarchaeota archaeon]
QHIYTHSLRQVRDSVRTRNPEQRKLERKRRLLERALRELDQSVVIVEGKKDLRALREIGVKGKVVLASGRMEGICSRVDAGRATILTDKDGAGDELAEMLVGELEGCGVEPDLQLRRNLKYVLGFRTVEEIPRKLEEFRKKLIGRKIEQR